MFIASSATPFCDYYLTRAAAGQYYQQIPGSKVGGRSRQDWSESSLTRGGVKGGMHPTHGRANVQHRIVHSIPSNYAARAE